MATRSELEGRKNKLQWELEKVEVELEHVKMMTAEQEIADELHSIFCHSDHTDQCDWYYDDWTFKRGQNGIRARYIKSAIGILRVVVGDIEKARDIVKALKRIYEL